MLRRRPMPLRSPPPPPPLPPPPILPSPPPSSLFPRCSLSTAFARENAVKLWLRARIDNPNMTIARYFARHSRTRLTIRDVHLVALRPTNSNKWKKRCTNVWAQFCNISRTDVTDDERIQRKKFENRLTSRLVRRGDAAPVALICTFVHSLPRNFEQII